MDTKQRLQRVLQIARGAQGMSEQAKMSENRVMGCTAQVYPQCLNGLCLYRWHVLDWGSVLALIFRNVAEILFDSPL